MSFYVVGCHQVRQIMLPENLPESRLPQPALPVGARLVGEGGADLFGRRVCAIEYVPSVCAVEYVPWTPSAKFIVKCSSITKIL